MKREQSDQEAPVYVPASLKASREAFEETSRKSVPWWKPEVGWNYIRILPPHPSMNRGEGKTPFFYGVSVHFFNGTSFACPRQNRGAACPLCDQAFAMRREGMIEEARAYFPNWRMYVNLVVLPNEKAEVEEDAEVLVWGLGRGLMELILDAAEEEGCDITDPEAGRIVAIKRRGSTKEETRYVVRLGQSPAPVPYEVLSRLHDLTRVTLSLEDAVSRGYLQIDNRGLVVEGTVAVLKEEDVPALPQPAVEDDEEEAPPPKSVRVVSIETKKRPAASRLTELFDEEDEEP